MLTIGLYDPETGAHLEDLTDVISKPKFSTNEQGALLLTADLDVGVHRAFRRYEMVRVPDVKILDQGLAVVWSGRLEDVSLLDDRASIAAFGHWGAYQDLRYSALWSTQDLERWEIVTEVDNPAFGSGRYHFDQNDRLYIAPINGEELQGSMTDKAGYSLAIPSQSDSDRVIRRVSFSYRIRAGATDWRLRLVGCDWDFGSPQIEAEVQGGEPTTVIGSIDKVFLDPAERIILEYGWNGANPLTITGETGRNFVEITGIRVTTVSTDTLTGDQIARGILDYIEQYNPQAISDLTGFIQSPGGDLLDVIYEDARPSDILLDLAEEGDTEGNLYEVGVWDRKQLYFRPQGDNSRTWYADLEEGITVQRTIATLINAAYVRYKDERGRDLRTPVLEDDFSVLRYGLVRMGFERNQTTGGSAANLQRDMILKESAEASPRSTLNLVGLTTDRGAPVPPWRVRAGDILVLRTLPVTTEGDIIDRVRTMRITETDYNPETGINRLSLEIPLPTLEDMVVTALVAPPQYDGIEGGRERPKR